jgi:hypothetical protein
MRSAIRPLALLCAVGVISSCASISMNRNRVGDPRVIGDVYRGTADVEIFRALVYHCYASFNRPFLRSMMLPLDASQPTSRGASFRQRFLPNSMVQLAGVSYRASVDPKWSFPDLPKGAVVKGTLSTTWPDHATSGAGLTVDWPIAEYKGVLYIVLPQDTAVTEPTAPAGGVPR